MVKFLRRGTSAVEACVALLLRHTPFTQEKTKAQTLSIKQASLVSQEIKNSESGVLQRNWKKMQFIHSSQLPVTSLAEVKFKVVYIPQWGNSVESLPLKPITTFHGTIGLCQLHTFHNHTSHSKYLPAGRNLNSGFAFFVMIHINYIVLNPSHSPVAEKKSHWVIADLFSLLSA